MTKAYSGRRLRLPIKLVEGKWEFLLGGGVALKEGTIAELIVDREPISDAAFLEKIDGRERAVQPRKGGTDCAL